MTGCRGEGDLRATSPCRLWCLPDKVADVVASFVTDVIDRGAVRCTCRRGLALFAPDGGTSLDLSGRRNVIRLLERCPVAPRIAQLRLQFCNESVGDGAALIAPLARFTALDAIDFGGCYDLQPEHLRRCLSQRRLRSAGFYWCPHLDDGFIHSLASTSRSLQHLNLSGAKHLTNVAIYAIAKNLHDLRFLDCTKLVHLSDKSLIALSSSRSAPVLQTLIFYACPNFTNLGLKVLVRTCRALRHVDICGSLHITDDGIASLARGSPHLERLNLTWCTLLTDDALLALGRHCRRLARLELRGVQQISDQGLMALSRDGSNAIRELDVVGCVGVTSWTKTNLGRLFPRLPALTRC